MPANSQNRKAVREAWGSILSAALTGAGKPVQVVYDHLVGSWGGQSPVVMVTAAGTRRDAELTHDQNYTPTVHLETHVLVKYAQFNNAGEEIWSDEDASDKLDDIEKAITDAAVDNPSLGGVVDTFHPSEEKSRVEYLTVLGHAYVREIITYEGVLIDG